ncbi:hypothetical protein BHM03_00019811, partial [Ensete ventricosum]
AEDGIGLPEEVLNDTRFEKAAKFYFVYIRLDFLWSLNLLALIILNFLEVSYEFCLACKSFLLFLSIQLIMLSTGLDLSAMPQFIKLTGICVDVCSHWLEWLAHTLIF